jgi:hypothetical protein
MHSAVHLASAVCYPSFILLVRESSEEAAGCGLVMQLICGCCR